MANLTETPFYLNGLHFSCTRCSSCCRHEPGYVFLSINDIELLAEGLKMQYTDIVDKYCRWVSLPGAGKRLSLKEKQGFDCIFWQDGCIVYQNRPIQCRSFPFWESSLRSAKAWEALSCPGIGCGTHYSREQIDNCLEKQKMEPIITRVA